MKNILSEERIQRLLKTLIHISSRFQRPPHFQRLDFMPLSFTWANMFTYIWSQGIIYPQTPLYSVDVSLSPPQINTWEVFYYGMDAENEKPLSSTFVFLKELFGNDRKESLYNSLNGLSFETSNCEKLLTLVFTCYFLSSCIHHFQANSLNSLSHKWQFPEKLTLGTFCSFQYYLTLSLRRSARMLSFEVFFCYLYHDNLTLLQKNGERTYQVCSEQ